MALLLETNLGDLVIDLDVEGSPEICKNVLKLAKARYYTSTLVYNIQPNRFCQLGDSQGDGAGGACIYGLIASNGSSKDALQSRQRFLKSSMGRPLTKQECQEKGRVVATEMNGIPDTIGSQLLITISDGQDMALDGFSSIGATSSADSGEQRQIFRSVGIVREDENNVLDKIAATYCDADGRPYADIRVKRALIVDDPFDDPPGMDQLLMQRGVVMDNDDGGKVTASPEYERPPEESVEIRIQADQVDPMTGEEDLEKMKAQEEELLKREDKSRAVVLEMLGDLPSAEATAPENVLFVCKLNPVTEDEDLELIFSRFDEKVKAEIIRDQETGNSLQYAFIEFTTKEQAAEAYFKMDNALVDDRRIKVDFSQSVAKVWNKYTQRSRNPSGSKSNSGMPKDPFADRGGHRDPGSRHVNRYGHPGRGRGRGGRGFDRFPRDVESSQNRGRSRHERDYDFGGRFNETNGGKREEDRFRSKRRYDSDESSGRRSSSLDYEKQKRRRRSRSRSEDRRDRKHRKHRKSRKHHRSSREKDNHRRRSHEGHDDRESSRSRHHRHKDGSVDRIKEGKREKEYRRRRNDEEGGRDYRDTHDDNRDRKKSRDDSHRRNRDRHHHRDDYHRKRSQGD